MLGSFQETSLPSIITWVGTKFQGHIRQIPPPPNHPLTIDDIGPPIILTRAVIIVSPLIQSYKYTKMERKKGGWEVHKK